MSKNGELRPEELRPIAEGEWLGRRVVIRLAVPAANAYTRMNNACWSETRQRQWLEPAFPDGGYRDLATQAEIREDWYAKRWARHNLDPNSKAAPALPGTSPHGDGLAVDIWGPGYEWAIHNGPRFGFTRPLAKLDPHHFVHDGRTATAALPTTPLEDTMALTDKIDRYDRISGAKLEPWTLGEAFPWLVLSTNRAELYAMQARDAVLALAKPDVQAQARALAPLLLGELVAGLNDKIATDEDLAILQANLLAALANVDEATLATFGLRRA